MTSCPHPSLCSEGFGRFKLYQPGKRTAATSELSVQILAVYTLFDQNSTFISVCHPVELWSFNSVSVTQTILTRFIQYIISGVWKQKSPFVPVNCTGAMFLNLSKILRLYLSSSVPQSFGPSQSITWISLLQYL